MKALRSVLLLLCTILPFSSVFAEGDIQIFVIKKQEEKKKSRWTLGDWLLTKEKMRLQDQWLAMNSGSPFEFFLTGNYQTLNSGSTTRQWNFGFAAYAAMVGLEFQYNQINERMKGLFNLRLVGRHAQGTNLTVFGGLRFQPSPESITGPLAGASLTLYLTKFLGIEGSYQHYFQSSPAASGTQTLGSRWDAGMFIDFSFLRIQGGYFSESVEARGGGTPGTTATTATTIGTKIFF